MCREGSGTAPERDDAGAASLEARSLVFRAGGRVYACDVAAVREVVPLDARARLTRLPGAPATVVGLLNVRGKIVTVFDCGALLHAASPHGRSAHGAAASRSRSRGAHTMALIVDCGARGVGLVVERVADVRALRVDEGYQRLDVRALVREAVVITEE